MYMILYQNKKIKVQNLEANINNSNPYLSCILIFSVIRIRYEWFLLVHPHFSIVSISHILMCFNSFFQICGTDICLRLKRLPEKD